MKYICSICGTEFLKWSGKCSSCGEWGSLEEYEEKTDIIVDEKPSKYSSISEIINSKNKEGHKLYGERVSTGFKEIDRVLGKGLVKGEVVLISGEPGIGKSTLLMQVVLKNLRDKKILYICGEESPKQLYSRLVRLSKKEASSKLMDNFLITEDTIVERVVELIKSNHFDLIVVDSIQSVSSLSSKSYPGSISQVRVCGALLTRVSKTTGIPMLIVGQINKGGDIAGPKVLEHIVDCVLYIEGDQFNQYRILRSIKNRFGSTNEIGVFEMRSDGLKEVGNPSLLFLETDLKSSGSAISAILQGSRVVFVEVQALVVEREGEAGPLRRIANGIKKPRLDMLCAVMSRKGGVFLGDKDVFVNIVGGFNVNDPAIDLAVCAAIKSSAKDIALDNDCIYFGEVGLTGEVRGTWGLSSVIEEATRSGYSKIIVGRAKVGKEITLEVKKITRIKQL